MDQLSGAQLLGDKLSRAQLLGAQLSRYRIVVRTRSFNSQSYNFSNKQERSLFLIFIVREYVLSAIRGFLYSAKNLSK